MKKDKNSDRLSVIKNYNFYDTQKHKQSLQLFDWPGPEGQVSENLCQLYLADQVELEPLLSIGLSGAIMPVLNFSCL